MKLSVSGSITLVYSLGREGGARGEAYDFWGEKHKMKFGATFSCLHRKLLIFSEAEQLQPWCVSILLGYTAHVATSKWKLLFSLNM